MERKVVDGTRHETTITYYLICDICGAQFPAHDYDGHIFPNDPLDIRPISHRNKNNNGWEHKDYCYVCMPKGRLTPYLEK